MQLYICLDQILNSDQSNHLIEKFRNRANTILDFQDINVDQTATLLIYYYYCRIEICKTLSDFHFLHIKKIKSKLMLSRTIFHLDFTGLHHYFS